MNSAIIFNQNPIAEERIVHFRKCNAINVRDFSGTTVIEAEKRNHHQLDRWGARLDATSSRFCGPDDIFIAEIDVAAENVRGNF